MNKREVFDKVKAHLLAQGQKSLTPEGRCAYRGTGGVKCAVGVLIDDTAYTPVLENQTVGAASVHDALLESGVPDDDATIRMLERLQTAHDYHEPESWPVQLRRIEEREFGGQA